MNRVQGFKWVISLGLMAILITQVDLSQLVKFFPSILWMWVGVALTCEVLGYGVDTLKWQYLLVFQKTRLSFRTLVGYRLVGQFFNNFLPSNIGGDATRMIDLSRRTGRVGDAVSSVVMARVTGVFALIPMMSVLAVMAWGQLPLKLWGVAFGMLSFLFAAFVLVFWWERVASLLVYFSQRYFPTVIGKRIGEVFLIIRQYRKSPRAIFYSLLMSVGYQLCGIFMVFFLFHALSVPVSFLHVAVILPLVATLMMLPVSINGLGIQDVGLVYLFGWVNVSAETVLLVSLLLHGIRITGSLLGGLVFLFRSEKLTKAHFLRP